MCAKVSFYLVLKLEKNFPTRHVINQMKTMPLDRVIDALSNHIEIKISNGF
jgi:hypothetical protein